MVVRFHESRSWLGTTGASESATPPVVASFAKSVGVSPPTARAWGELTELQRFALIKLTRDSHDNVNFVPAMREFGLVA